ncbi:MAG: TonB family protein [Proteobacteria bacterium]|nr:TonB family protein [Pseudomonadota bacterium]
MERYVHAGANQEEAAPAENAALSSADRRADVDQRSTVIASAEGALAPPSATAGTPGSHAGQRPMEDGREHDPEPVHAESAAAADAAKPSAPDTSNPTDAAHGRVAQGAHEFAPALDSEPVPAARQRHSAAAAAPSIYSPPESGRDLPTVDVPDWWEAGASRPAAVSAPSPVTPAAPEQPAVVAPEEPATPPSIDTQAIEDIDDDAVAEASPSETESTGDADEASEADEQTEGQRDTPLKAPTDLFRESMGWRAGGSPGQDASGASTASNQVVTEKEATAAVAKVNTRQTPRGVYAAHIERTLIDGWYATDISIEQRTLGAHGQVTVLFRIRRSGRVADLVLTKSSGDAHMDHLALTSVPKRFARFPSDLRERFLIFEWTFHYRD